LQSLFGEDHTMQTVETPIWHELLAASDWAALRCSPTYLGLGVARGHGEPVVLVPGFLNTDLSLGEMFWWLSRIGYDPHLAQVGVNADCPDTTGDALAIRVRQIAHATGKLVHLIGHSLGGLLARHVAMSEPDMVAQVITLAAPFREVARVHPALAAAMDVIRDHSGGAHTSNVRPTCFSGHCACRFTQYLIAPQHSPVRRRAIYSRRDGLVAWQSCVEDDEELNVEITSTHTGMTVNAGAFSAIARLLEEACREARAEPARADASADAASG
ncbi:MAG: alpha/beta fold hydrolase, partial [Chloroflexi bacterium]|nr:alpha/beta fold hydrolase [Chloroflexota bacterium]